MKLKLTGLVRDVELTKRKYLDPDATASTHIPATVTIFTSSITTAATKAKGINGKNLGYTETVRN